MSLKFKILLLLVGIGAGVMLSGCGGGSSGGAGVGAAPLAAQAGDPAAEMAAGPIALTGRVSQGVLAGATVSVWALAPDGAARNEVGAAVTGADGSYRAVIDGAYSGGPLEVKVVGGSIRCATRMGCGAADFGAWFNPGGTFSLSALVPSVEPGADTIAQVTPFTHMALARARGESSLTTAVAIAANHEVGALLGGIDVLRTAPLDLADAVVGIDVDPDSVAYSTLIAGVARLAAERGGHPDAWSATLDILARSFRAGWLVNREDPNGPVAASYSLEELVLAARAELDGNSVPPAALALLAELTAIAADGDPGEPVDPRPDPQASADPHARAHRLLDDLHPWVRLGQALERPADLFAPKLEAVRSLDDRVSDVVDDLGEALAVAAAQLRAQALSTAELGGLDIAVDASGGWRLGGHATRGAAIALTVEPRTSADAADGADLSFAVSGSIASADVRIDFPSPVIVSVASDPAAVAAPRPVMRVARIGLSGVARVTVRTGVNPAHFTGSLKLVLHPVSYETAVGPDVDVLASRLDLRGLVSHASDSFALSATTVLRNAASLTARTRFARTERDRPRYLADFGYAVSLEAQLAGEGASRITLAGTRAGLADPMIALRLRQGDSVLRVAQLGGGAVTYRNPLGTELELLQPLNGRSGELRVDGVALGTLVRTSGLPEVRFNDGSVKPLY